MTNIENYNVKELFDENKDWKIVKEELEKLGLEVQLSGLEQNAIDNAINTSKFIPDKYREKLKKVKDFEEKKWYVFLFQLWSKLIWQETLNILASEENGERALPFDEVVLFLYKLIKIEEEEDKVETATVVLTIDEIKDLKENILAKNIQNRLTKLETFIKEQLNENISSAEAISWTKLAKEIENSGIDTPANLMKNLDTVNTTTWALLWDKISKDTIYNMWTWFTLALLQLVDDKKIDKDISSLLNIFKSNKWEVKNKKNLNSITKLIEVVKNITLAIKNANLNKTTSENNDILMNPIKFKNLIIDAFDNNLDKWDILEKIQEEQKEKHAIYNKKEVLKTMSSLFNNIKSISSKDIESVKPVNELWKTLNTFKEKVGGIKWWMRNWVEENKEKLIWYKKTLEDLWIWEMIKDIINWILKWLWYKNGWDDIEKSTDIENGKEKFVLDYLKDKTNIENIKKEKNNDKKSIFYKWFENNLKDNSKEKISTTKATWNISQKAMYYLTSLWTNQDSINENLEKLFESENFKKALKKADIKEEDFYKKAFNIVEEKDDKWNKINVWEIDFNEISKVIEKAYEKEIEKIIENKAKIVKEKYTAKDWVTLDKLPKKQQEEIKKIWTEEENKFANLVQKYFPKVKDFSYTAYLAWIGYVETRNRYNLKNGIWAVWKYQFMPYTLKDYGVTNPEKFKENPVLQEQIMAKYTEKQFKQIVNKIKSYVKSWADIAYFLAKSHLWGAWAVLENKSDGNISQKKYAQKAAKVYNVANNKSYTWKKAA